MTKSNTTIIVGGYLGFFHSGGAVWDYIQYPLGLHLMGYDVYYIEDTRMFPVYTDDWQNSNPTVQRLKLIMERFGLGERWVYRDEVTNSIYGKTEREYHDICSRADIFINVSCASVMREEYLSIPTRILVDSDPMFTQIQITSGQSFTTEKGALAELASLHTHHFTFGENINSNDCLIPNTPFDWMVTRQPVCLALWDNKHKPGNANPFTTLMNWKAGKLLQFDGTDWGQKDLTFPLISDLPIVCSKEHFEIVISQTGADKDSKGIEEVKKAGWNVVSSKVGSGDHSTYRLFILNSKGEISVAKETYVKARTGWFSCRSACYLAAGRPVVTQDTGWSSFYSTGKGLFSFSSNAEAVDAINEISSNWDLHAKAAREIAHECFDHNKVLRNMLDSV